MPMLKTLWGCTSIAGRLEKYLEGRDGKRALAVDTLNVWQRDEQTWGQAMDETRLLCARAGRKRSFAHVVISPDERDGVTLEQLRELATAWAEEFFGDDAPRICQAEVAIVYHDDNERRIPHAHVVVNNLNLENGRALDIDNKQWKAMTTRLQELAWERGLRGFDDDRRSRLADEKTEGRPAPEVRATMAERKRAKDGRPSWKQEIKDAIEVACNLSDSPEQVVDRLAQMGIVAMPRKAKRVRPGEDYIFYYPQPGVPIEQNKKRVSGERLGRRYTAAGMRAQIRVSYYRHILAEDKDAAALLDMLVDVRDVQVLRGQTLSDLSNAFAAITNFHITNMQDAEKSLAEVRRNREKAAGRGLSVAAHEEHIRQLEALLRVGPAANIVPLMREQSATAHAIDSAQRGRLDRHDAEMAKAEKSGKKVSLQEKVEKGYRLTKAEHEELKRNPAKMREWQTNRRYAERGMKRGGSLSPTGSSPSSGRSSSTPSQGRARGARRR